MERCFVSVGEEARKALATTKKENRMPEFHTNIHLPGQVVRTRSKV